MRKKIQQHLILALKKGNDLEVLTIRQLLASIINKEKEKREELSQEEIIEVIGSEAKKRRESIAGFEKGNRQDLVQKEKLELEILQKYLPEQLSKQEIRKLAQEAVQEAGDKEIGKVMSILMPKVKGRADGKIVSQIVKELLS